MQREEGAHEEGLVFLFERQSKAIDDGPKDLQELRDPVVPLGLVNEVIEHVVDRPTDGGPQVQELAVDSMERGLEEIAFAGIFRVEKLEEVENEGLIDVSLGEVRVEVRALDETEEELVYDLEVRPCEFENRLVLFRVEGVARGINGRGYSSEEIGRELGEESELRITVGEVR